MVPSPATYCAGFTKREGRPERLVLDGNRGGIMQRIVRGSRFGLVVLLMLPGVGFSQAGQQAGTLIVAGHARQAPVTQLNGRPYVAVDALAKLMNGSVGYQGNTVVLTLPHAAGLPSTQPGTRAFSRDFLNAGIETTSDIREWRSALLVAVEHGYKVTDAGVDRHQAQAARNLQLATVAATTDADHNALALLKKELGHMQQLNDKVVAARKNLSYLSLDAMQKDPLDQKILKCAHSLGEMVASGEFHDDGSCH